MRNVVGLLIISWLTLALNIFIAHQCGAEWLGRSGAIMVLFAVMAEYQLLKLRFSHLRKAVSKKGGYGGGATGDTEPEKGQQLLETAAHVSVIIGTFVWGYGDKFI